ncbi:MAG: hypothetical protein JO168_17350 [Solirubrobacterales bacterium]|nr:hypothetical protein [Solirubrobacterales bacterium]MBV9715530.1 hypothetical protein [Solirubrobacterales bacterium]
MAQTKRKRRTKHRGTAAGNIEVRGRTGRPLTPEEKKKQSREDARQRRLNTPPTWKAALQRAAIAAVLMFVFISFFGPKQHRLVTAAGFAVFALVLYVPAGYYMDQFQYRRRQRKRAETGDGAPR